MGFQGIPVGLQRDSKGFKRDPRGIPNGIPREFRRGVQMIPHDSLGFQGIPIDSKWDSRGIPRDSVGITKWDPVVIPKGDSGGDARGQGIPWGCQWDSR